MKSRSDAVKCSMCEKEFPVIELRYCGDRLCNNCFSGLFEKRVRRTIRLNRLLENEDKVAVALSGGKDSAAVLYLMHHLFRKAPNSTLTAITIDQGIGSFQKECLDAAKALCKKLGVDHHVYSFREEYGFKMDDVVKKTATLKRSPPACSYCGVLRRNLINVKARELGMTKLATGHNMDDEIQASLMNFIKGDFERMARMGAFVGVVRDKAFIPRIKPLRDCPENEVRAYANLKGLDYAPGRCPYSREAFRQTVRKVIEEVDVKHPGSRFQILKSTDKLIDLLRKEKSYREMEKCSVCGDPTSGKICRCCEIKEKLGVGRL